MVPLKRFPFAQVHRPLTAHASISRSVIARRNTHSLPAQQSLPLAGVRVLEVGQVIAGPFCGQMLGYVGVTLIRTSDAGRVLTASCRHFGAEVIKVEPPHVGDPLRVWRELDVDGVSPWWRSIARNKKSVTIDLRKEEGRAYGLVPFLRVMPMN